MAPAKPTLNVAVHDPLAVQRRKPGKGFLYDIFGLRKAEADPPGGQAEEVVLEIVENKDDIVPSALGFPEDHLLESDDSGVVHPPKVGDLPIIVYTKLIKRPARRDF